MQQEHDWRRRAYPGLRGQCSYLYYHLIYISHGERNFRRCIDTINATRKKERQLLIDLAARAYELDKGHPPASVAIWCRNI